MPDPGATAHNPPYYLGDDAAFHQIRAVVPQTDFYMDSNGSNSNNGLSPSTPWATFAHAVSVLLAYDLLGQTVTVHIADGTYIDNILSISVPWIGGKVEWVGNFSTPHNVYLEFTSALGGGYSTIGVQNSGVELRIGGVYTTNAGSIGNGFVSQFYGLLTILGSVEVGACTRSHFETNTLGALIIQAAGTIVTISGNATQHVRSGILSSFTIQNVSWVFSITVAFTAFFNCSTGASIFCANMTISGTCTGSKICNCYRGYFI